MLWLFVAFGLIFLTIAILVSRRAPQGDVDDFVVAGRRLPFGVISASVMVSWLWTTSLLGAAEAGYLFGVGGGFAFALGSAIPFFIFIPIALRLRRIMPEGTTFLEFIKQRYGRTVHHLLLGMTLVMALYICTEQIIGVAYAVSGTYDISYAAVVIGATAIVVGYIAIAGLRGAVINDVIQFVIIAAVALVLIPIILSQFGIGELHAGLTDAATNPDHPAHNPSALSAFAPAAVRYFAVAMVVSMGFVLLNQGYYSKARAAASDKSLLRAYVLGTIVAWLPIPILFGMVLGGIGIAEGLVVGEELRVETDVAVWVFNDHFGAIGVMLFALTIFMAGLTTASNSLAGYQAAMAVDVQEIGSGRRTSAQRKRFTQYATIAFGLVTCLAALALEGVSLLAIDIFSGIIFAAPVSVVVLGMIWKRLTATHAVLAVVLGLASGLTAYFAIADDELNYFVGNLLSLLVPVVVLAIGQATSRKQYDFDQLLTYRSATAPGAGATTQAPTSERERA